MYKPIDNPSQIILVPRREAITCRGRCGNHSIALCNALDAVEADIRSTQERGDTKHVVCEEVHKYSCVGTQPCRGAPGICSMHYALEKRIQNTKRTLSNISVK